MSQRDKKGQLMTLSRHKITKYVERSKIEKNNGETSQQRTPDILRLGIKEQEKLREEIKGQLQQVDMRLLQGQQKGALTELATVLDQPGMLTRSREQHEDSIMQKATKILIGEVNEISKEQ